MGLALVSCASRDRFASATAVAPLVVAALAFAPVVVVPVGVVPLGIVAALGGADRAAAMLLVPGRGHVIARTNSPLIASATIRILETFPAATWAVNSL